MKVLIGGIFGVSEWIMRFAVINLLWLFFNFPIVILVLNMLFAEEEATFLVIVPLVILAPFTFFPATTAMFASVRDWTLNKESTYLVKSYLNYYKKNYNQSMRSGFVLTALWGIWFADFYYFSTRNVIFSFSFLLIGVALFVYTINFFSLLAHFDLKIRKLLKNALIITLGSPILSAVITIGCGLILYVSINGPLFLIPFFTGSILAFLSFSAFYRFYFKLTTREQ